MLYWLTTNTLAYVSALVIVCAWKSCLNLFGLILDYI